MKSVLGETRKLGQGPFRIGANQQSEEEKNRLRTLVAKNSNGRTGWLAKGGKYAEHGMDVMH